MKKFPLFPIPAHAIGNRVAENTEVAHMTRFHRPRA